MKEYIKFLMLIYLFLSLIISVYAQSTNQNYIQTTTYIKDGDVSTNAIQYFDGLGRPMQTVLKGITPQGNDLASYMEYDGVGREWKNYLPIMI